MTKRTEFTASLKLMFVAFVFAVIGSVAAAQSVPLSEVEVRLVRTPHGGCAAPCTRYSVTVRGDGTVRYDGSVIYPGTGQVDGVRTRSISVDEVIALVNEFLKARFFDALAAYRDGQGLLVRKGDMVELYGFVGGSDDPQADLTLRIGDRTKTVTMYNNYPTELGRLSELADRIGGPRVWP